MRKKKLAIGALVLIVYFILIFILLAAESAAPSSGIQTLPDAIWYSLVTMTTVGYGDIYPETGIGRVIAAIFMFMSLGMFAILVSAALTLVRDRLLPRLRLALNASKKWYVFDEVNDVTCTIAKGIKKEHSGGLCIFSSNDLSQDKTQGLGIIIPFSQSTILSFKRNPESVSLFFTAGTGTENLDNALRHADSKCPVYVMTPYAQDSLPKTFTTFSPFTCMARLYWREHPVSAPGETIVLIGSGKCGESLLEQALLVNVIHPDQSLRYHVYGSYDEFKYTHRMLSAFLCLNSEVPGRDAVYFHEGLWNADAQLLEQADRILLCDDDETINAEVLSKLSKYYATRGQIHAKISARVPGVTTFGETEKIFTPELVMSRRLDQTAMMMHEIYRRSAGGMAPAWEELSDFARRSNQASADHLRVKISLLLDQEVNGEVTPELCRKAYEVFEANRQANAEWFRRLEHERWDRFHFMNNWSYAPERNNALRKHPLLKPFEELPLAEQEKDDFAWELLKSFAEG